ncbi:Peptidase M16C associated domain protein [Desulfovibrio sp. X2]|uniref:insulinase family protein n=1 Tax=Desulfovibrio sp. X2 TaxID=941449 RepID=UPI000358EE8E|nr:insulinase family protein [Desulfovibrio sp. X2]EPR39784.1 Peptidase M16C associated domain protein [Desulfovibrio sp. X2]
MSHGFTLLREENVPEIQSTARIYRHDATGARLLSVIAPDENKVFGIAFRTPPRDSTGVAHILEHSVLCGSRKYPVKEPFVELLKGSLQTFLNAFTYPDKTCYPVASANLQDFYNLVDVYLDAVFYPRITEHIFKQEGWHYELDAPEGPLSYKGVVFNEMKGAYSSPDSVLAELSQQSIFPDTTYGLDSGGDPERIPDLTFAQFTDFHRTYYHPANAWMYFYGDDDPEERLRLLAAYLDEYGPLEVDSEVRPQPRLPEPRRIERGYAAAEDGGKAMATLNWLLPETVETEANLALRVLEEILLGMPSSPLRKALLDSGLGEDVTGGLETELRHMYFSVGLKGLDPVTASESQARMEEIVARVLSGLADTGIPSDLLEAALNTVEFAFRENNTGRFPRGLALWLRSLSTGLYGGDPLALISFEAPLAALKMRLASGEKVFENMLREHFLDNPHRSGVLLTPDPELLALRERIEGERLRAVLDAMDDAARARTMAEAKALQEEQAAADSPEALASIPMLGRDDLPRENRRIPGDLSVYRGARLLAHDLPTTGIAYLDVGFSMASLPREHLPLVPLFGRALLEMGTAKDDFTSLTRRIARVTGGMGALPLTATVRGEEKTASWLFMRGKATAEKAAEMAELFHDVLLTARFDDPERFRQMLLEEKARTEQRMVPAGHGFVSSRLAARFTTAGLVSEMMGGVDYLFTLRRLLDALETQWPQTLETLESIRRTLLTQGARMINLTADETARSALEPGLNALIDALPQARTKELAWKPKPFPAAEGLTIPAQVNYVGKGVNLKSLGIEPGRAAPAVSRWLRAAYLWDRVRVQGGAYGAFCSYDEVSGNLFMVSYRDPNLKKTLATYDATAAYLEKLELSQAELDKAVVGAIGDIDSYQLPDAKGFTSLARLLTGRTEEELQERREAILGSTIKDFRDFAQAAAALRDHGQTVVMGPEDGMKAADLGLKLTRVL